MEQWVVDGRSIIQKRPNGSFIPGAYPNIATDPEWVDLSGLQAVYKKVLREGSGPTPKIYAEVSVNYKYIAKGIVVDTQGDAPMDFVCGGGSVTQGMDETVLTMKVGEICRVIVDPAFGFRDEGFGSKSGKISVDEVIEMEIELLEFEDPLSEVEKCEKALWMKEEGNKKFAAGDVEGALSVYNRALYKIGRNRCKSSDPEVVQKNTSVRLVLFSNIMMCMNKKKDHNRVIEWANKILAIDPKHGKALFRRSGAYEAKIDFERAIRDLETMLLNGVNVEEATAQLALVKGRNAVNDAAQKESYSKIFKS